MIATSKTFLLLFFLTVSAFSFSQQKEETEQQKRMAQMMAETMDHMWDQAPDDGSGNLQILMTQNGQPFSLPASIYGKFAFKARKGPQQIHTAFNPNTNGRWINEGMKPGTYDITIQGLDEFEGMNWEFNGFEIKENGITNIEITLE